ELPEEEVAEPHLPARADEEVGIGNPVRAEVLRDGAGGDLLRIELAPAHPTRDRARGAGDLLATAVADREDDRHPGVPLRRLDRRPQGLADCGRQPAEAPHREQTDLV